MKPAWRFACVALVLLLQFGVGVFDHDLWFPTEPRVASIVADMTQTGDLVVPKINGIRHLENPPLYYWCGWLACRLGGQLSPGLLRLPAALLGLASLAVAGWISWRRQGERAAWAVMLAGATALYLFQLAHRACPDIAGIFFVFLALALFAATLDRPAAPLGRLTGRDAVLALVLGAAFYARNFYVHLLVLPPILLLLSWRRAWRRLLLLGLLTGAASAVLILPWALGLFRAGGWEYLRIVFFDNTIGRFFTLADPGQKVLGWLNDAYVVEKGKSPFIYLAVLPLLMLPWILLYPAALARFFRRGAPRSDFRLFLTLALVTIPLVLSLSSSRSPEYLVSLQFVLLLILGEFFRDLFSEPPPAIANWQRRLAAINILLVALPVGAAVLVLALCPAGWARIHPALAPLAGWPERGWLAPPAAGLLGALWVVWRRRPAQRVPAGLLICAGLMVLVLLPALRLADAAKSYAPFFAAVRAQATGQLATDIIDDRKLPLIPYYLGRRVDLLEGDEAVCAALRRPGGEVIMYAKRYENSRAVWQTVPHRLVRAPSGNGTLVLLVGTAAMPSGGRHE